MRSEIMSAVRLPKTLLCGAACALAVLLCGVATLRADDYLKKFKKTTDLNAQKTAADVKGMLLDAQRVRKTNPQEARVLLQTALARVDDSRDLSDAERTEFRRQITAGLAGLDALAREQAQQADLEAQQAAAKLAKDAKLKGPSGGNQKQGSGVTGQAADYINSNNKTLMSYGGLKDKRDQATVRITNEIYETYSNMEERRITERFIKKGELLAASKYTKAEKELLKALNSVMTPPFKNVTLKEAIEYIQEKTNLSIFFDEVSLKEAGVEYDTDRVNFTAPTKMTVRTILKKILADKGLSFIIKEAAIQVMTPGKAKEQVVARAYPVQDLVQPVTMGPNPYFNRQQMYANVNGLILNIMNSVEPGSWQINGGRGTITFHEPSMSLIITNTAEFHYQMGGALQR
jgi:hypothetical protein